MPQATIHAFKEHGTVRRTVDSNLENTRTIMENLEANGIELPSVAAQLEDEGIEGFSKSYAALIADVEEKSARFQ
jgi:transaldolase